MYGKNQINIVKQSIKNKYNFLKKLVISAS